ncbi:MAG: flavin reductase family protein [Lentisphaerae bacterium]|nr:flavin reductase family protein [Lentisphaerota bacterium]
MELPVLEDIAVCDLAIEPMALFDKRWFLLTAGDFAAGRYNTMTISWGSFGTVWNKPFVQVFCRPQRYTFNFMESFDSFTLCTFRPAYRSALQLLGSRSGRVCNKIAEAGLTPMASRSVAAPGFAEAELIVECKKIYAQPMDPQGFKDGTIDSNYPSQDYHHIYFGEISLIRGSADYVKRQV